VKILLWAWQFPQHLLGLILTKALKAKKRFYKADYGIIEYWEYEQKGWFSKFISGVSFGQYIILPPRNDNDETVPHEHGHSIQSLQWGWLYLVVIGIPSAVFNNLWDRLFHQNWTWQERYKWYYSRFPEKQADRAGGVNRRY